MDRSLLKAVCEQIYRRFPEVNGSAPKVQSRAGGQWLVVFRGSGKTADGHSISPTIRAVVAPDGKILKVSTSKS